MINRAPLVLGDRRKRDCTGDNRRVVHGGDVDHYIGGHAGGSVVVMEGHRHGTWQS